MTVGNMTENEFNSLTNDIIDAIDFLWGVRRDRGDRDGRIGRACRLLERAYDTAMRAGHRRHHRPAAAMIGSKTDVATLDH
jgi:hypothetical protein